MEQTISSVDVYDTSSGLGTLQGFFNDPNSAIIFILGIFVSSIFLIAVTKVMYGPKKPNPKPVPVKKTQPRRKPNNNKRKPQAPKPKTQTRRPRKPKTQTKQ